MAKRRGDPESRVGVTKPARPGDGLPVDQGVAAERGSLRLSDLLLLGVGATFWPLNVLAQNLFLIPTPLRVWAVALVAFFLSIGLAYGLIWLRVDRQTAVSITFVVVVLLMTGGRLFHRLGDLAGGAVLAVLIGTSVLAIYQWRNSRALTAVIVSLAVLLATGPLIALTRTWSSRGDTHGVESSSLTVDMAETPDIFVVALDGYPGFIALDREYGMQKNEFRAALVDNQFQLPASAWSAYPVTALSLSSLLEMSYPVDETYLASRWWEVPLYRMISGENALIEILSSNGYTTHMVESGWSGHSCGPAIDHCHESAFLDEAVHLILRDTVARPIEREVFGHPFTFGAQRTMRWLSENAEEISRSRNPDFVFTHVIAPHPPFYLDQRCRKEVDESRTGWDPAPAESKNSPPLARFVEQTKCVDRFLLELANLIEPSDILIFVSDHGAGRYLQTLIPARSWTRMHLVDRLNVLVAVRAQHCDIGTSVMLPNLFRRVLSCHAESPLKDLQARMFLPGGIEVDQEVVDALLNGDIDSRTGPHS